MDRRGPAPAVPRRSPTKTLPAAEPQLASLPGFPKKTLPVTYRSSCSNHLLLIVSPEIEGLSSLKVDGQPQRSGVCHAQKHTLVFLLSLLLSLLLLALLRRHPSGCGVGRPARALRYVRGFTTMATLLQCFS